MVSYSMLVVCDCKLLFCSYQSWLRLEQPKWRKWF